MNKKNGNTEVLLNGIVHSLDSDELNYLAPMIVAYSLNELKVSTEKAIELAIFAITLHKAPNAPSEAKLFSSEVMEDATKWRQSNRQSEFLLEAGRSVIQNFLKNPPEPMSLATLFLKCVLIMASVQVEKEDLTVGEFEGEWNAIKGLYEGLSNSKISEEEFLELYKNLANKIVAIQEGPLDSLKDYSVALSQKQKELLIKCLFLVSASKGKIDENERTFISAAGATLRIDETRFVEILKEAKADFYEKKVV